MEQLITRAIESFIFPPGLVIALLAIGILLLNKRFVFAKVILWAGVSALYLFSTPIVADLMIRNLESYPALNEKDLLQPGAGAIVILAGGRDRNAQEYGGDTVGPSTLVRTRYGAYLQRKTNLPILVSGGRVLDMEGKSLAQTMASVLKEEFNAGTVWLEEESRTTGENALFSKKLLSTKGINSVYLVTQAWHMPRSVTSFQNTGLEVIPAPTAFESGIGIKSFALLPSISALKLSNVALHELVGIVWYKIRY